MTNLRSDDVDRLLKFLKDRDVDCPLCGYNLRDLTKPVCPECKQDLKLTVGLRKVRFGWFIITIAPGIFSGIAAFLLLMPIILVPIFDPQSGQAPPFIILVDLFGWTSGIATFALILNRNSFLKLRANAQIAWAAIVWAIHIGALATFLYFVAYVL